jgi:hypothetical protein
VARRKGRHQIKKKKTRFHLSLSVVARRKGRHQQKKKTLSSLSLKGVESREWRHQQQNKPVRLIELTSPDFWRSLGITLAPNSNRFFFFQIHPRDFKQSGNKKRKLIRSTKPKENRKRKRANQSISDRKN